MTVISRGYLRLSILLSAVACAGCAGLLQAQEDQTTVAEVGGKFKVVTYRELAAERAREQQEDEELRLKLVKREEQRAAYYQESLKQEQKLSAEAKKRVQEDETRGYKHMSFTDFELDYKTLPLGSKLALTGFYRKSGEIESLAETHLPTALEVTLLTDSAARPARQRLLECRAGFCRMTVLGHTTKCDITYFGHRISTNTCLVMEKTWE